MIRSHFIQVHRISQARPDDNDRDSGSLARTLRDPRDPQMANGFPPDRDDNDANIIHLWERVDRLSNRLTRTSPHVQSIIDSSHAPPRLSLEEISRVIEPLKARFQKTASPDSALFIQSIDEDQLAAHSRNRLKTLQSSFPDFTTRKRVYFKDEPKDKSENYSGTIPKAVPSHDSDSGKVATMSVVIFSPVEYTKSDSYSEIQPTGLNFKLLTLDIVSFKRQRVIVGTDEHKNFGALHYCEFLCLKTSIAFLLPIINLTRSSTSAYHYLPLYQHSTGCRFNP